MRKRNILVAPLLLLLVACGDEVVIGPIPLPASAEGSVRDIPKSTTSINNIEIRYQDHFDVKTAIASFYPKGIIPGERSPMIPLSEGYSDLQALGFTTSLDNEGKKVVLQYNDSIIRMMVDDATLFINDRAIQLIDRPFYHNQTIYVPIIPILDALKIDYSLNASDLIIGGMYTDDSRSTGTSE